MYEAIVRWAPTHELILSLGVYLNRKGYKLTDLGAPWASRVEEQLTPAFAQRLEKGIGVDGSLLHLLVEQHGGGPDADTWLQWVAAMPPGELYERLAPCRLEAEPPLPSDMKALRDEVVEVLGAWNQQYFTDLEPVVFDSLAREAVARQAEAATLSPQALVEAATNGIVMEPIPELERVVLIPGYHSRPVNHLLRFKGTAYFIYGYDEPTAAGEMPVRITRVLKALADDSRVRILRYVSQESRSFMEIKAHTGLALSTVHHHMVTLRAAGLVRIHETTPYFGNPGQGNARYSFRPAALQGLGERIIESLRGGALS